MQNLITVEHTAEYRKESTLHCENKIFPAFSNHNPLNVSLNYVLISDCYDGLPEEDDDFDFEERFIVLKSEFEE